MHFFTSGTCIPNALSWWLFPHSNAFSQKLSGLCLGKMHFFTSRNAFQMLFHGDCFHIQMHFLKNCRVYASAKCIFSLPEMHSKCSFMVAVSTFKCIFSSLCLGKMHFFTSRNAFQMLFHGGCFHIQMHFSQILSGLCLGKMHFFTSRNAFQMLFHGGCFHIQMHFFKYCLVYASTQMYFFHFRKSISNAHSWRLLPHSYEILFRNVRLHTSVHARVRALARTEQLLQIFF